MQARQLLPDLWVFEDSCNVYVLKRGDQGVAIDVGSGAWIPEAMSLGIRRLAAVLVTHAHRDQVDALTSDVAPHGLIDSGTRVGVSALEAPWLQAAELRRHWLDYQRNGCPGSYQAPIGGLERGDLEIIGEHGFLWPGGSPGGTMLRIAAVPTPGHGRGALTYLVIWDGRQVAFCGDACVAGGRVPEWWHLEWDHWTPEGAIAARHGLSRLAAIGIDLLCPSHGPAVMSRCRGTVRAAGRRLDALIRAKGAVASGERDRWLPLRPTTVAAILEVRPGVLSIGNNTYLVAGTGGEALVIDPTEAAVSLLPDAMAITGTERIDLATATHYHRDHTDGLLEVRRRFGCEIGLHPWVAQITADRDRYELPWLPFEPIETDRLLPEDGTFEVAGYTVGVRPYPGQTWWHCAFDLENENERLLFSGDNFQPPGRWNGTGGFCAYNGSRFRDGFSRSARVALAVNPDIVCNGHRCIYRFDRRHYRRILRWSRRSQHAIDSLERNAGWWRRGPRSIAFEPFRATVSLDGPTRLVLRCREARPRTLVEATLSAPEGWRVEPASGRANIDAAGSAAIEFDVVAPSGVDGRAVVTAAMRLDGRIAGTPAVALLDPPDPARAT